MTRREWLQLSSAAWISESALSGFAVRNNGPENLSYPLKLIEGRITPPSRFFVRDHFDPPIVSLDTWKLQIEGLVEHPYAISFSDLVEMPSIQMEAVLECAGNAAGGAAVSNGLWEGVRLSALLGRARLSSHAAFLLLEGADSGRLLQDTPPLRYSQLIPLDKCLNPSSLIAFKLNELALPAKNGFPARALFPAWYAMDSVKWLQRIVVLGPDAIETDFHRSGMNRVYNRVVRGSDSDNTTRLSTLQVKSAVAWPGDGQKLPVGRHLIWGFAWSGSAAIRSVAITTAGGDTWNDAAIEPSASAYGWVKWAYHWDARPGEYVIMSRASDKSGNSQPLRRDPARKDAYELNWCLPLRCSVR